MDADYITVKRGTVREGLNSASRPTNSPPLFRTNNSQAGRIPLTFLCRKTSNRGPGEDMERIFTLRFVAFKRQEFY